MPLFKKRTRLSKVNTRHLLDDVADGYKHSIEQTIIVEAVANALDAGASSIAFDTSSKPSSLTVIDNGVGMNEAEFESYHDLAQSAKVRGEGIGFAGLGAKLAHKLSSKIKTDTKSKGYEAGSDWSWHADDLKFNTRRARIESGGTKVQYLIGDRSSVLLDPQWIENTLVEHFGPLLEQELANFYVWHATYPNGVDFSVNGTQLQKRLLVNNIETTAYRDVPPMRGKRSIGKGVLVLSKNKLPEEHQGIALTTHGKVITRLTFGLSPADADKITGWIEIPELVKCLTLNKQDFMSHGQLGQRFRRLRDQAKKIYSEWLSEIGRNVDQKEIRNAPRRLENELAELAKLVPEIDLLLGRRTEARIPIRSPNGVETAEESQGTLLTDGPGSAGSGEGDIPVDIGSEDGKSLTPAAAGAIPIKRRNRKTRKGPRVQLVREPRRSDMSWIDSESVMINIAHPAYAKSQRERQVRYHQRNAALIALCDAASDTAGLKLLKVALSRWGKQ